MRESVSALTWPLDRSSRIAYVSFEGTNSEIYIQDVTTGKRERVASNPGINSAPAWSPDGKRLALTLSKDGNPEIYIMNISNKSLTRITNNFAIDTEPTWSSDGKFLAFTSDRGGNPQIYEVKIGENKARRLSFNGAYNAGATYSPDDDSLAVVHGNKGVYKIGLLDRSSGQVTALTDSRMDESPSFAPNGHMIIYTTTGASGTALAAISVDGTVHQRLALQKGEVREPVWGPFLK
ncbi:MAG: hypothetical protein P8X93_09880 [Gammaproteobacteria bacterium]